MKGTKRGAGLGRGHRELLVERRAVVLGQITVRLSHRGDALSGELLGQALLVGGEHALAPPARLRGVGGNHLHPELAHRAPELRPMVSVDLAAGLGRVPVVRAAVGVQARGQPPGAR